MAEPLKCHGCKKIFKPGDRRVLNRELTMCGTLIYHPTCRRQAIWNNIGMLNTRGRRALEDICNLRFPVDLSKFQR